MCDEEYSAATDFFLNIMTPDDILDLKVLMNKIVRARAPAKEYFEKHCRDVRELEEFFKDNEDLFYLENRKVALYDERLLKYSEMAVNFFKEKLQSYNDPVDYMQLKTKHLEEAPRSVCYFITRFYPGKEIKRFFKRHPDIFVLLKDHKVFLIEVDSVEFYRKRLKRNEKLPFNNFRGKIGQAPPHVQEYMNRNYLGDEFQDFLIKNSHVFKLDDNGFVSLVLSK